VIVMGLVCEGVWVVVVVLAYWGLKAIIHQACLGQTVGNIHGMDTYPVPKAWLIVPSAMMTEGNSLNQAVLKMPHALTYIYECVSHGKCSHA
jgi:hypothetical protein